MTLNNKCLAYACKTRYISLHDSTGVIKRFCVCPVYDETPHILFTIKIFDLQEAVIEVLRSHPIKPHWMFALDNLVRAGVQAAITVLSPEIGENLANHSSPSTINSSKSSKCIESFDIPEQILQLRTENNRLIQDMLEMHKQLQYSVSNMKLFNVHVSIILHFQMKQLVDNTNRMVNCSCQTKESLPEDPKLKHWLNQLKISEVAQNKVLSEGYTLKEFRQHITKDDLRTINLRGASELRIWLAIEKFRRDEDYHFK